MDTKHIIKKNIHIFTIIAVIWLVFSSIHIIQAANEWNLFDALYKGETPTSKKVAKKIDQIQNTFEANNKIKNQDYETALSLISGTRSEDYYNRGTIQTLLAYQNALESNISGLETAQILVTQAQNNFEIAKKLWPSTAIHQAIKNNQSTIENLSPIIDVKTCYTIGQNIISSLGSIDTTIQNIKTTLDQEEKSIDTANLSQECNQKLHTIVDTSKEQVNLLQNNMKYNKKIYLSDFSDKLQDPMICITTPYDNILPSIIKGKEWLEKYQETHQNSLEAIQSKDETRITELCEQTKNDAQIQQNIENAIEELLSKLEENTTQQKQKWASQDIQYKDFFSEKESEILKEIEEINQWWIYNTLNIRGRKNYKPQIFIDTMFNQFYGNSGDFIDLHK